MLYCTVEEPTTHHDNEMEMSVTGQPLRVATLQPVKEPVHFGRPRTAVCLAELPLEIVEGISFLLAVHLQRVADVADVVERLEFGDAAGQHHRQQSDEDVGMLPQTQIRFSAQLHKPVTPAQ